MKNRGVVSIDSIVKAESDHHTTLSFDFHADGRRHHLWYKVDRKYGRYLCDDRCDGFVVSLIVYAMINGMDVVSPYPISEKLYYQLTYHVIPQIYVANKDKCEKISIVANTIDTRYPESRGVAAGMSCGVDSFTTLYEYTELCPMQDYRITHLTYFNVGAHHGQLSHFDFDVQEKLFNEQLSHVQAFCSVYGYQLVVVDSNLTTVLDDIFGFCPFERTHTFRNVAVVLLMQKLFCKYYYSSAANVDAFSCDINRSCSSYDKYLLPLLSTENIDFYSSNQGLTRLQKVELISRYDPSYDWLKVCLKEGTNCGVCMKCKRTLLELDWLGVLDKFSASFNIDKYRKHRDRFVSYMYKNRRSDVFMNELYQHCLVNGVSISLKNKVIAGLYTLAKKTLPGFLVNQIRTIAEQPEK